ncbi:MAG: GntR family transcriptional regulator [Lawsonibacter sp.]|nr:GntR family transcriptional regulator [Lawsonibacter sp.]
MKQSIAELDAINTSQHRSAAELVIEGIKQQILCRTLLPGDQLPNEFELCKLFNVSRGSLREAIKILVTMGILELRPGVGTFVATGNRSFVQDSLFFSLFLTCPNTQDIVPLRRTIEIDVLEFIINNFEKNQAERAKMKHSLEEMEQIIQSGQHHSVLIINDIQFHNEMAAACKNGVIESIYRSLIDYIQHSMRQSDLNQTPERIYSSHAKIVEVVENKRLDQISSVVDFALVPWKHS